MHKQHKYTKPATPLTEKVWADINAKALTLVGKFKDFQNEEKREWRRNDVTGRLAGAVMKAYAKFKDNDRCSFESYAFIHIASEYKHYVRDYVKELSKERVTLSIDVRIDGEDGEAPTFADSIPDSHNRLSDAIGYDDLAEAIAIVRLRDERSANALELFLEGYKLNEIAERLRVEEREFYDCVWPTAKSAMRQILDFRR